MDFFSDRDLAPLGERMREDRQKRLAEQNDRMRMDPQTRRDMENDRATHRARSRSELNYGEWMELDHNDRAIIAARYDDDDE